MDDRLEVDSVELTVDSKGKVWLNVNGECVFRCRHSMAVMVDLPAQRVTQSRYIGQIQPQHIVIAFVKEDV